MNFLRNRVISLEMNPLVDDLLQNLDLENYKNGWLSGRDPGLASLAQNQHPLVETTHGSGDFSEPIFKDLRTSTFFNQRST